MSRMNAAKGQLKQIIIKFFVLEDSFLLGTVGVKANRSFDLLTTRECAILMIKNRV